jgi:hypothetical protein
MSDPTQKDVMAGQLGAAANAIGDAMTYIQHLEWERLELISMLTQVIRENDQTRLARLRGDARVLLTRLEP